MTSPPRRITIECPNCGNEYSDWHRPSINLDLETFSEEYIAEAASAACPDCGHQVELGSLVVRDGVWSGRPAPQVARDEARDEAVKAALEDLRIAERARLAAIDRLKDLGAVRSRSIVGEIGEEMAAAHYGVKRATASMPGYDLIRPDGKKVQVKTLRATPGNFRTTIGRLHEDYDVLLAIRLDADYEPINAIEISRQTVEQYLGNDGRLSWTRRLESDPATTVLELDAFRFGR